GIEKPGERRRSRLFPDASELANRLRGCANRAICSAGSGSRVRHSFRMHRATNRVPLLGQVAATRSAELARGMPTREQLSPDPSLASLIRSGTFTVSEFERRYTITVVVVRLGRENCVP